MDRKYIFIVVNRTGGLVVEKIPMGSTYTADFIDNFVGGNNWFGTSADNEKDALEEATKAGFGKEGLKSCE